MQRPEVDVGRGEGADDGGEELGGAPLKESARAVEDETVFVGEAIGEAEVREGGEKGACGGVHEGEGAEVVGFGEGVVGGESGGTSEPGFEQDL